MPYVLLIDRDHVEAALPEPSEPQRVVPFVDDARVIELALHLEDDGKVVGCEVDAPDPARVVPQIDLATEGRQAGALEDLHHS